jgi:hypothetical protein
MRTGNGVAAASAPMMSLRRPNARDQSRSLMIATGSAPGRLSSRVKSRPRIA